LQNNVFLIIQRFGIFHKANKKTQSV
jgi:hypothetical protein